jgi:hypothetical protein
MPLPPTTVFFRYDENGMSLNDVNFENNTEFEFYQELSNVPDLLDQENTGSKLCKDYSFLIRFQDSNWNEYIKQIKLKIKNI